jgi:hypothetical protein
MPCTHAADVNIVLYFGILYFGILWKLQHTFKKVSIVNVKLARISVAHIQELAYGWVGGAWRSGLGGPGLCHVQGAARR